MNKNNFFKLIAAVAITEFAGIVGSVFTTPAIPTWYATLTKPTVNPPAWIFGPVWTALYALMGVSLYLVWKNGWKVQHHIFERKQIAWNYLSERFWRGQWQKENVVAIFGIQLLLNILWPYIFFGLHAPGAAFFEMIMLWFAIIYTIVNFYRISKLAAYLLIPYLLWVSFALYLNYAVWMLN